MLIMLSTRETNKYLAENKSLESDFTPLQKQKP